MASISSASSAATDAFFVAFRIPNLLRRLFAEGAFAQAFVPILGEFKAQRLGQRDPGASIDHVATVLTWSLVAVAVLGIIGTPAVVWLLAERAEGRSLRCPDRVRRRRGRLRSSRCFSRA